MFKCEICNKEYSTMNSFSCHVSKHMSQEEYYCKYMKKDPMEGICPICNNKTKFIKFSYSKFCSKTCSNKYMHQNRSEEQKKEINEKIRNTHNSIETKEKTKQTNIDRYGVPYSTQNKEIQDKRKHTCIEKYGVDCSFKSEQVKNKIQDTIHKKYGEDGLKSKEIREKAIKTYQEHYGVDNPYQAEEIKEKIKLKNKNLYGVDYNTQRKDVIEKIKQSKIDKFVQYCIENDCIAISDVIDLYGTGWYQNGHVVNIIKYNDNNYCIKRSDLSKIEQYFIKMQSFHASIQQEKLFNYICTFYSGCIEINKKSYIYPYELDIVLPDLKLAIEYNGTYWHSIERGIDIDYHLKKSLLCREQGIRLIHIYEFEDLILQQKLLKDIILGQDNYPKNDFNKNNFGIIPKPEIIYKNKYTVYGAGKLY